MWAISIIISTLVSIPAAIGITIAFVHYTYYKTLEIEQREYFNLLYLEIHSNVKKSIVLVPLFKTYMRPGYREKLIIVMSGFH